MALEDFPFPFTEDTYAYSNNVRPLLGSCLALTSTYAEEMVYKRTLLTKAHDRCFRSFPNTLDAQWEAVEYLLSDMEEHHDGVFRVVRDGDRFTLENALLGEKVAFSLGDASSIPCEPLDFIGRHVQEDLILMMERDGDLYLDAGQLCFAGNWSLAFNHGMTWLSLHGPVPTLSESGLAEKIRRFLLRMVPGQGFSRLNWSLNAGYRLDTSPETLELWYARRFDVTRANAGDLVHLRVEAQNLCRLPRSNAILFTIRTHLLPVSALLRNPDWYRRTERVVRSLSDELASYKGFQVYRQALLDWCKDHVPAPDQPEILSRLGKADDTHG